MWRRDTMNKDLTFDKEGNFVSKGDGMQPINEQTTYTVEKTDIKHSGYVAVRILECLSVAAFIFGFLWNGTEVLNLTTPQFMMLYGGSSAVICEVLARLFSKKKI
jgi:hypothetical protein